jgi:hypothetical protein
LSSAERAVGGWTVDLGGGPVPCDVPHVWSPGVDVRWEGPAIYRTVVEAGLDDWLVFDGASYQARIRVDGHEALEHRGIWDAFALPLAPGRHEIEVAVVKNGGPTFPVRDALSGFQPYVFHTFGGLFRPVRLVQSQTDPTLPQPVPPARVVVEGRRIRVDGRPFTARGVLDWGWNPDRPGLDPTPAELDRRFGLLKQMGFNLVKYCLWLPSHGELEALAKAGLFAWIELPLWMPSSDPERLAEMAAEVRRIVGQYRHHSQVVAWTCGCELGGSVPRGFREELFAMVRAETGCPLVKDDSGSAEMYGGDPVEFGTFDDYHPYCDLPFFGPVLESLGPKCRAERPTLLGEFNDFDVYRPLGEVAGLYWASADPAENDQGARWQFDLPMVLASSPLLAQPGRERRLARASRRKGLFVRQRVADAVAAEPGLTGSVLTGLRHTPISTSGVLDDEGDPVWPPDRVAGWNGPDRLFLISARRPPWVAGGNRPGWQDPFCRFVGGAWIRVGLRSELGEIGELEWAISGVGDGRCGRAEVAPGEPDEVGALAVQFPAPGLYRLKARFGRARASWRIRVVDRARPEDWAAWRTHDPVGRLEGHPAGEGPHLISTVWDDHTRAHVSVGGRAVVLLAEGPQRPFWRECVFDYPPDDPPPFADRYEWLYGLTADRILPTEPVGSPLMLRVDTRTFEVADYVRRVGNAVVTTLRPEGGLGATPHGVVHNAAGAAFMESLRRIVEGW